MPRAPYLPRRPRQPTRISDEVLELEDDLELTINGEAHTLPLLVYYEHHPYDPPTRDYPGAPASITLSVVEAKPHITDLMRLHIPEDKLPQPVDITPLLPPELIQAIESRIEELLQQGAERWGDDFS